MKVTLTVLFLLVALSSVRADVTFEIGAPVIGVNQEWSSLSLGLSTSFYWQQVETARFDPTEGIAYENATVFVVVPTVRARWFLADSRSAQPFLIGAVSREIEVENELAGDRDSWGLWGGMGLRTGVTDRVFVGAETGITAALDDEVKRLSGAYRFFLHYRL